jgi:hypothetical protein
LIGGTAGAAIDRQSGDYHHGGDGAVGAIVGGALGALVGHEIDEDC